MLPEKIGDYKILDSLGSGAFGDVYKVEKDGNLYALKHIVLGSKVDNVILQLEVDSHGSIPKHDNIVGFVDYFKSWYRWNIVLEFCDKGTLESYLVRTSPDNGTVFSFMLDMASGLNHLHSNNIVHRDIKPENILLVHGSSDTPRCKISDFGVARFISDTPAQITNGEPTEEKYFQTLRGTPFFVAPEVRRGQYTKSCDIFSLGIVYYLMFSREVSSDKRLMPYARGGTPFYKATDIQIKNQMDLFVHDERINKLICSMMMTDLHARISASELEDELRDRYISFRRVTRQNNVLNILSTIKEQLDKLEEEGYSALCMWQDLLGDSTEDSTPGVKSIGPGLPSGEINNFLDRFTGLVGTKHDDEHLDSHSETSDSPEGLDPSDEYSTCSRMSTQSSPFEIETYSVAVNTTSPSTSAAACQTDLGLAASPPGHSSDAPQSLPSTITLSGLAGVTLTCPASITLSSPAGITLSSSAGISLTSILETTSISEQKPSPTVITTTEPDSPGCKVTKAYSETSVSTESSPTRSRVSSTSSVHTADTGTNRSPQCRSNSVKKLASVGRSSSFAAGRKNSGAGRGTTLERSSSSASSRKPTTPVTRAKSSPAVTNPLSVTRTITSPKVVRKASQYPHPNPPSPKSKSPSSPTTRKSSSSRVPASSDTSHAAAHNHPQPVSVKSPTMKKKKQPSPAANRKSSSTSRSSSSHSVSSTQNQHPKTSSHTTVNAPNQSKTPSHAAKTSSQHSSATTHTTTKTSSSISSKKTSPPPPLTTPSPEATSFLDTSSSETTPTPQSTPSPQTPPTPKTTPKTTKPSNPSPSKKEEESKGSVFGRFFRWK